MVNGRHANCWSVVCLAMISGLGYLKQEGVVLNDQLIESARRYVDSAMEIEEVISVTVNIKHKSGRLKFSEKRDKSTQMMASDIAKALDLHQKNTSSLV